MQFTVGISGTWPGELLLHVLMGADAREGAISARGKAQIGNELKKSPEAGLWQEDGDCRAQTSRHRPLQRTLPPSFEAQPRLGSFTSVMLMG